MSDSLNCICCFCEVFCLCLQCCTEVTSIRTQAAVPKRSNSSEKLGHYDECKIDYRPPPMLPLAPSAPYELAPMYSPPAHYIPQAPSCPPIDTPQVEIIISTNESILHKQDSIPQLLISSILQDSVNNKLSLNLAKEKLEQYTGSSENRLSGLIQSLEKNGMCECNILCLAVILTAICPESQKSEMLFSLYHDHTNAEVVQDMTISRMVAQTFDVSVRHLTKLVQDSQQDIEEVRKYCNRLEEGRGLYMRSVVSLMLDGNIELSRGQFMMNVEDQLRFLMSSSEIRKEIAIKFLPCLG